MTIILYIAMMVIVLKAKVKEYKFTIIFLTLIIVLLLYFIRPVLVLILQILGDGLAGIRNIIDNKGQNYIINLVPIIGFLIIMISSYHRVFSIPEHINIDGIEVSYENGVLKIILPKKEIEKKEAKPIEIK